jgi:hypothetical protein
MQNDVEILLFGFVARTEIIIRSAPIQSGSPTEEYRVGTNQQNIASLAFELNDFRNRQEIADELQRALSNILPGYRYEVDISFKEGSLLAIGTILLTSVGALVWDAAKPEITKVLQFAIKKALERVLPRWLNSAQKISDMTVKVTQSSKDKQLTTPKGEVVGSSEKQLVIPRYLAVLTVTNTVLLLILLISLIAPHLRITP